MDIKVGGAFYHDGRITVCGEGCEEIGGRNGYGERAIRKGPFAVLGGDVFEFHNDDHMIRVLLSTECIDADEMLLLSAGFRVPEDFRRTMPDVRAAGLTPTQLVDRQLLLDLLRQVIHEFHTESGLIVTDDPSLLPTDKSWVIDHAELLRDLEPLVTGIELELIESDGTDIHPS